MDSINNKLGSNSGNLDMAKPNRNINSRRSDMSIGKSSSFSRQNKNNVKSNIQQQTSEKKVFQQDINNKSEEVKKSKKAVVILDKLILVSVFMLFTGLPLFFLNLTYQGINFEKQYFFYLWTFIGIVAWGAKSIVKGSVTIRRTPLDFSLLAFLIIYGLSTIFSIDRYHSFFGFFSSPVQGFVSVVIMILAYYLIIMNINYSRAKILLTTVIITGSFVSLWFFFDILKNAISPQVFSKIPLNFIGISFSSLATYLGMMIMLLLIAPSLINSIKNDFFKKILNSSIFLILAINIFNISTLFDYVRWIPFLISISILLVFILGRVINFSQKMLYVSGGTFLLLITLFIIGKPIFESEILPQEYFGHYDYELIWQITKNSIKNNPILGSGPSTYGYDFSLFSPHSTGIRFYSSRGLFESLATVGILGCISIIVVILTYIGSFVHMLNKYGGKNKIISLGLFVAVVNIIFTATAWNLDGGLIIFGVLLTALSIRIVQKESNSESLIKTFSLKASPQYALMHSFLFLVGVTGIIFGFVTFSKMFLVDLNAGKTIRAQQQGKLAEGLKYFRKINESIHKEGRYYTIGAQYSLLLANKSFPENDKQAVQHINNAVQQALLGVQMMPNDVFANEVAGFIYESGWQYISHNALEESRNFYKKSSELEPENPFFYLSLGKIDFIEARSIEATEENFEFRKGLVKNAQDLFELAKSKFSLSNQHAPVYYYLSTTNEFLGEIDEAIKNMEKAVEISKISLNTNDEVVYNQVMAEQINYGFNLARLLQIRGADKNNKNAQGDNEKAESLFKQILDVNADEINVLLSLGVLYESEDRWDEAIVQYNKVLKVLPDDAPARENVQKLINDLNVKKQSSQNDGAESNLNEDINR
ncbi:MAG: hypothetical protein KAT32_04615 [Candidatus Moranbacteria bacterium]|nr:hypothetical protein [Candidatus Moranbacteria bacterium]